MLRSFFKQIKQKNPKKQKASDVEAFFIDEGKNGL